MSGWDKANATTEVQRIAPAAAVVAEYAWLAGHVEPSLVQMLVQLMEASNTSGYHWHAGDIGIWLYLTGTISDLPEGVPEPYTRLALGDWEAAARFWDERRIPYERAVALSFGDNDAKVEAVHVLDRLGNTVLAKKVRAQLQREGATRLPRRPQRKTRKSRLGLTPR